MPPQDKTAKIMNIIKDALNQHKDELGIIDVEKDSDDLIVLYDDGGHSIIETDSQDYIGY